MQWWKAGETLEVPMGEQQARAYAAFRAEGAPRPRHAWRLR